MKCPAYPEHKKIRIVARDIRRPELAIDNGFNVFCAERGCGLWVGMVNSRQADELKKARE